MSTNGHAEESGPDHYRKGSIEPIEFILANPHLGWCEGNVIKYVYRHRFKGRVEDLKKARAYLDILIEYESR